MNMLNLGNFSRFIYLKVFRGNLRPFSTDISTNNNHDLLIAVNQWDTPLGPVPKRYAHLNSSDSLIRDSDYYNPALKSNKVNEKPPILHRAFSLFHFSRDMKLLITRRSPAKETFPLMWSNTVCSHPLWSIKEERGGEKGIDEETMKSMFKALKRRVRQEMNMELEECQFLTRLMYLARSRDDYAEYEMDYIFLSFSQKSAIEAANLSPNPEEIINYRWVSKTELLRFIKEWTFSPWSLYILNEIIFKCWGSFPIELWAEPPLKTKIHYSGDITTYSDDVNSHTIF